MGLISKSIGGLALLLSISCVATQPPLPTEETPQLTPSKKVNLGNPATQYCLEQGYHSEPILSTSGMPTGHLCIHPETGQKCEEWAYFRGECQLEKLTVPQP